VLREPWTSAEQFCTQSSAERAASAAFSATGWHGLTWCPENNPSCIVLHALQLLARWYYMSVSVLCVTAACPNTTDSYRICKPTGKCLSSSKICDSIQDCPDDSDEVNCSQYRVYYAVFRYIHLDSSNFSRLLALYGLWGCNAFSIRLLILAFVRLLNFHTYLFLWD